jgi:hypothetical protein
VRSCTPGRLYCNSGNAYSSPPPVAFWSYDLDSKHVTTLLTANTTRGQDDAIIAGDYLYIREDGGDSLPDRVYKLPLTGGAEVEVPIEGNYNFHFIGTGADGLYLVGRSREDGPLKGAIYRLPLEGGNPEVIVRTSSATGVTLCDVATANGQTILRWMKTIYKIPANGKASVILDVNCEIFAIAADDKHVYFSMDTGQSSYALLRAPL